MKFSPEKLIGVLLALVAAMLVGAVWLALHLAAGTADAALRGPMMLYALAAFLVFAAAAFVFRRTVKGAYAGPVAALARDLRTLLETKQLERGLRVPEDHELGDLPGAVEELVDSLRGARRETKRAMATATARVEQEKGWLEVILLELIREGVVVCSADHRILLYNHPTARLFRSHPALGLGRPLFNLVAEEPVQHALERLEYRLQSGSRDLSTRFVCATRDSDIMLQASIALIVDVQGKPGGYVLTLEDISAELTQLRRSDFVRRAVTQDLRGPLASLRAAAETLMSFNDLSDAQRQAFQEVILKQSAMLSQGLETVADIYEDVLTQQWPMAETYSRDLFQCMARRVEESAGLSVDIVGDHQWLKADSHSLMLVLAHLLEKLASELGEHNFQVAADKGTNNPFIELRWTGAPIGDTTLGEWLEEPLTGLPGISAAQVLEQHGGEAWSRKRGDGGAMLHIPLKTASESPAEREEERLPPRPEYYDFDLMQSQTVSKELSERRLKDLTYVVFDTEATGLQPTGGDQLIEIAAVRVTGGRVMTGETFDALVNPGRSIPKDSIRFHGITDDMVADKPPISEVLPRFHEFVGDGVLVAHNAAFDMKFLKLNEAACGVSFENPVVDTLLLSALVEGDEEHHSLDAICDRLQIEIADRHRALGDALATAHVLVLMMERLVAQDITTFGQLMRTSKMEAALRVRALQF